MTRTELIRRHNELYKALNALLELSSDKYRQAINKLRDDIADIDSKLAKQANETTQ